MKKSAVLAKIETLQGVLETKLVTPETMKEQLGKMLSEKSIRHLPEDAFAETPHLLEFAKAFDLVKGKSDARGGFGRGGSSYGERVKEQYPDIAGALAITEQLKQREFTLAPNEDGSVDVVQYMPYWRKVQPEGKSDTSDEAASAASEENV